MTHEEHIMQGVMPRVWSVYFLRTFLFPFIAELVVIALFLIFSSFFVSLHPLVTNAFMMMAGPNMFVHYVFSAVTHTEVPVQILLAGVGILSLYFLAGVLHRLYLALRMSRHPSFVP